MTRDKRPAHLKALAHPVGIRWAARLQPGLLRRLYETDVTGIQDDDLCDEVGISLLARCETFHLVYRNEVRCPMCGTVFKVVSGEKQNCPGAACAWFTDSSTYGQSVANFYAWPGRAVDAFEDFYQRYPAARGYQEKIILIDQLIHNYHLNAKGNDGKSVASKLLEGNKKAVVAFLDALSARDGSAKEDWRRHVAGTIDGRMLGVRER